MRLRYLAVVALLVGGCGLFIVRPSADEWEPPVAAASGTPLDREPCAQRDPLRQALFGDLHVHTGYSFDARSRGMVATADDAYRFARGEEIGFGPFDASGKAGRRARLQRPLDFAAVTDHAEFIGEVVQCTSPGSEGYDSEGCRTFRGEIPPGGLIVRLAGLKSPMLGVIGIGGRRADVCGDDAAWCRDSLSTAWQTTQRTTEQWYDRTSACSFTTFHGWEHSYSPGRSKVHRNVIFRNEVVPNLPISSLEQPEAPGLWARLEALCNQTDSGCEAVTIPHNPNVSNGRLLRIRYREEDEAEQRRRARLQERIEPLVEMMQIKGESECAIGLAGVVGEDELCNFEKMRWFGPEGAEDCGDGVGLGGTNGRGCQSRRDFARYALVEGLREQQRIGVNPLRFGFIGSTDTHNATPGDVEEYDYEGCCANRDSAALDRLSEARGFAARPAAARNPGGLMGVWAEENSRGSIFDAMKRRETFATSGPRIRPRFFGGWALDEDACAGAGMVAHGYEAGVAMGGSLGPPPEGAAGPRFVAHAAADPGTTGHPGGLLDRLQIIKVWPGEDGLVHQAVYDVAVGSSGSSEPASVDLRTCEVRGDGARQLCGVWSDPDFDPSVAAAYYVRVLENPSCRWSWRQCLSLDEGDRPAPCSDPLLPQTIQERAWTSPIWFSPATG